MRGLPIVVGAGFLALCAGPAAAPADGICVLSVTHLGAPYLGEGTIPDADVEGRTGKGRIPACDDTPGGGPVEQPTDVSVHRVRGVAPRFAIALPSVAPRANLLVLAGGPCQGLAADRSLACLRRRTVELREGPALVVIPSASIGQVIQLGIRIRDRRVRAAASHGLDALFQGRVDGRWRSLFHLLHPLPGVVSPPEAVPVGTPGYGVRLIGFRVGPARPVQLPAVGPGQYRIAKRVNVEGRQRWLFAPITIQKPGQITIQKPGQITIQKPGQGTFRGQASASVSTTRPA